MTSPTSNYKPASKLAMVLTGGGARAAYQAGVIKGIAEIINQQCSPFPIYCGTSAGAINAVALSATKEDSFIETANWMEQLWLNLDHSHVYRSDLSGILSNLWRILRSARNNGKVVGRPVAFLDNLPLKKMLKEVIPFDNIQTNIDRELLEAVCVTAVNYSDGESISFFHAQDNMQGWTRWRRRGVPTKIDLRHLMGSCAIPTVFPPQRIGRSYFGDGALRQLNPVSPALHLGANKIIIISTSGYHRQYRRMPKQSTAPSFGQVMGNLLNSAFVDNLDHDIELMRRINSLIDLIPQNELEEMGESLHQIDYMVVSPTEDIDLLANAFVKELPSAIQRFLSMTGSKYTKGGVNIASYLLFTRNFSEALMDLGYRDAMLQEKAIRHFLGLYHSDNNDGN